MIDEIIELIKTGKRFLVTTHESPDGDALGSAFGLASFLNKIGKEVTVHLVDPVPQLYRFLPLSDKVSSVIPDLEYDVTFVLDVGEKKRAGRYFQDFRNHGKIINLDHHSTCEDFGHINLIDKNAAATGIIVYRIISRYGYSFDYETALCLYVAIITDTGSYRYSNSDREAFHISGDLISAGINAWDVSEKLYENQPKERLLLLAESLRTLSISAGGKYASVAVTLDMYERTSSSSELTDGFVNYPRSISGVEVAVFYREVEKGRFKVGFRSKGKIDVSLIASEFEGGGHHNAAGCNVNGTLEEVEKIVSARLDSLLS